MLKKTITYTTLNGEEVTEDFYFNLSKADLIELEVSRPGGLTEYLKKISASGDGNLIIAAFKDLLKKSYGQKSEDGRRFIKNDALWEEFTQSEAYSELFMQIVTDADAAAQFVKGIVPVNLEQDLAKLEQGETPATNAMMDMVGPRQLTRVEAIEMDSDELKSGLATGRYTL